MPDSEDNSRNADNARNEDGSQWRQPAQGKLPDAFRGIFVALLIAVGVGAIGIWMGLRWLAMLQVGGFAKP